jgi:hypothetical protein
MAHAACATFEVRSLSQRPDSLRKWILSGFKLITHSEKIGWPLKFALFFQAMTQLELVSKRSEFGAQMFCGVMAQFSGRPG